MLARIAEGTKNAIIRYADYHIRVNVVDTEWGDVSRVVEFWDATRLLGLWPINSFPKSLDRFLPKRVLKHLTVESTHIFEPIRFLDSHKTGRTSLGARGLCRVASAVMSTHNVKAKYRMTRACCELFDEYTNKVGIFGAIDKATQYK